MDNACDATGLNAYVFITVTDMSLTTADAFSELMATATAARLASNKQFEASLAAHSTIYRTILGFEALDGIAPGPPLAGDQAVLDALMSYANEIFSASFVEDDMPASEVDDVMASNLNFDPSAIEFRSIKAARKSEYWNMKNGFKDAATKEFERVVDKHGAMPLVAFAAIRAARKTYGYDNVYIKHLVIVSRAKELAAGGFDRFKTRITYADRRVDSPAENVYAPHREPRRGAGSHRPRGASLPDPHHQGRRRCLPLRHSNAPGGARRAVAIRTRASWP